MYALMCNQRMVARFHKVCGRCNACMVCWLGQYIYAKTVEGPVWHSDIKRVRGQSKTTKCYAIVHATDMHLQVSSTRCANEYTMVPLLEN